jgi:hypothetical protein
MIILALVAAFLFPTSFGLGYLARERWQNRRLEAAREEAKSTLNQTLNQVQGLARQVEALTEANQAMVRSTKAATALMQASRARPVPTASARPASSVGKIARNHKEVLQLQKRGDRNYREFTLSVLKRSDRVGPIRLTILSVDPQRKFFEASITAENFTLKSKRVNLHEPVWIDLNGHPKAVALVVNRIDRDQVQGYISEPKYIRMTLGQAPQTADLP